MKLDTWETEGQKRSKLRVVCDRMQMLGGGSPGSGGGGGSRPPQQVSDAPVVNDAPASIESGSPVQRDAQPTGGGPGYEDPDIPF